MPKATGIGTQTTEMRKKTLLAALTKTGGVVVPALKATGIPSTSHYEWMGRDPTYKEAVFATREIAIDIAEDALFQLVREKNVAAILFFLKCHGKSRGYVERQALDVNLPFDPSKPVKVTFGSE